MRSRLDQPPIAEQARHYSRTARRALARYGFRPAGIVGPLNRRIVFIVGCPRSGTTFTAAALGKVPGFVDLGEVTRLKAAVPELYQAARSGHSKSVSRHLRTILQLSQRLAMAARARGIEQTPESTFLIPELATAFPDSHFLHLLRDGRDVVSSLMERGWLAGSTRQQLTVGSACGEAVDEAGHPFGAYARFWVESDRRLEFEMASEARRCAWAWRRYVSTALDGLAALDARRVTTIRYEELVREPTRIAEELAIDLGALGSREEFVRALSGAHSRSVGNFRETLTPEQLDEVTLEAGALLSKLGYLAEGGTTE